MNVVNREEGPGQFSFLSSGLSPVSSFDLSSPRPPAEWAEGVVRGGMARRGDLYHAQVLTRVKAQPKNLEPWRGDISSNR